MCDLQVRIRYGRPLRCGTVPVTANPAKRILQGITALLILLRRGVALRIQRSADLPTIIMLSFSVSFFGPRTLALRGTLQSLSTEYLSKEAHSSDTCFVELYAQCSRLLVRQTDATCLPIQRTWSPHYVSSVSCFMVKYSELARTSDSRILTLTVAMVDGARRSEAVLFES